MARELFAKKQRKVVPFDQNGQFYYRKAKKHMNNNNYLGALNFYRKAIEKEPQNVEYLMDLAEVFTEMGCFHQSSKVLFSILQKEKSRGDCYFGLGCNFLGMQDYDRAMECFEKYLDVDPYGIYSDEARDLVDLLTEYEYYDEDYDTFDIGTESIYSLAAEGKDLLDRGEYKEAIKKLERVVLLEPNLIYVKNNLSLAYFCVGKLNEAINISLDVLRIDPLNIHANCNVCLFLREKNELKKSKKHLERIVNFRTQDPEELHKIAVTLCELKEHKRANRVLKQLLQYKPYDVRILHFVAVSHFNLGEYKEAITYWLKINKVDPDNTIGSYYIRLSQEYISHRGDSSREVSYHFQVPYDEILRRIKELNNILKLNEQDLLSKWKKDANFLSLLRWGLGLNDDLIKKAILNVVASFNDTKAEDFLREYLLMINESEELKTEALSLLKQMFAEEPYITYVDDDFVEVKVDILEDDIFEMPMDMEMVLHMATYKMEGRYGHGYEEIIEYIWTKFVKSLYPNNLPKIKKHEAWAAALELYYCIDQDIYIRKKDIADYYEIAYSTLYNNLNRLQRVLDKK